MIEGRQQIQISRSAISNPVKEVFLPTKLKWQALDICEIE